MYYVLSHKYYEMNLLIPPIFNKTQIRLLEKESN